MITWYRQSQPIIRWCYIFYLVLISVNSSILFHAPTFQYLLHPIWIKKTVIAKQCGMLLYTSVSKKWIRLVHRMDFIYPVFGKDFVESVSFWFNDSHYVSFIFFGESLNWKKKLELNPYFLLEFDFSLNCSSLNRGITNSADLFAANPAANIFFPYRFYQSKHILNIS